MDNPVYAIYHHDPVHPQRSAMSPLVDATKAIPIPYQATWKKWEQKSWRLGQALKGWGIRKTGSSWNYKTPLWDDLRFLQSIRQKPATAHFLWAEFAMPHSRKAYAKKKIRLVGTFHAASYRQPQVMLNNKAMHDFDKLVCTSKTQQPFFQEKGVPIEKIEVIPLGIDTHFFHISPNRFVPKSDQLQALYIGGTDRDHAFMAQLLKTIPKNILTVKASIPEAHKHHFRDTPNMVFMPRQTDQEMVQTYQKAELLLLPLKDSAANCTLLEAASCGLPIMVNTIGGVPEYLDEKTAYLQQDLSVEAWREKIYHIHQHREENQQRKPLIRKHAKQFDWEKIAASYLKLYRNLQEP